MGSLYGFKVESELPLRRLNAAAGTRGTLRIEAAGEPLKEPRGEPDGLLEDGDGRRWYASHELDGGNCLLALPPSGAFLLDPQALRVIVDTRDEDRELLEHRIASAAACTLLAMRGDLALHAAGVAMNGRAVIFCGPTRRGKSTLARTLGEAGRPLLGEDGIVIELGDEGAVAFPGARGVRMRCDGGNDRAHAELLADPGPAEPPPCAVAAVVLLGQRRDALEVERLAPARALAMLTPNLIHTGARSSIATAFARLARLLGAVPAYAAALPDDLAALPASSAALLDKTGHPD